MTKQKTQTARIHNFNIHYQTRDEFHHLKREIFTYDSYFFETDNPTPVIIDAGAHIGLSTLYFKYLYPAAKIIAIEPNPAAFALLEQNVFENQLDNVTTINAALWETATTLPFYRDRTKNHWFSTAGFHKGAWTGDQKSEELAVSALPLSELIQEPIDFLKMDIEGAESTVLFAAQDALPLIKHCMIEFHPRDDHQPKKLIELLEPHFSLKYWQDGKEIPLKKVKGLFTIEGKHR